VTLIENHPGAAEDARRNVERLGADHVTVLSEDVASAAARVIGDEVDCVIIDPPRAGCSASVLDALIALEGDPTLVYISCEPRKLARDVKRLTEAGYRVADLALFDMFPHTPHVEVAVALRRAG
jgi:23S rRNA (uracil1939-C5)-methyltransferase